MHNTPEYYTFSIHTFVCMPDDISKEQWVADLKKDPDVATSIEDGCITIRKAGEAYGAQLKLPKAADEASTPIQYVSKHGGEGPPHPTGPPSVPQARPRLLALSRTGLFVTVLKRGAPKGFVPPKLDDKVTGEGPRVISRDGKPMEDPAKGY